jgi:hypothetical protein
VQLPGGFDYGCFAAISIFTRTVLVSIRKLIFKCGGEAAALTTKENLFFG